MVEISKHLFDKAVRDVECYKILHPWCESCSKSLPETFKKAFVGSTKFYSIVYLPQILLRGKKMLKKEEWLKMGEYYVRSTLLGCLICGSCSFLGCITSRILGYHNYYSYMLIPSTINGLCIYLEPPSRRGLVVNLFCNLLIEYWLRTLERDGYLSITKSKTKQTLMFMIGSAFLFYLMRLEGDKKQRTPLFWLFTPEKVKRETDVSKNVCPHEGPCKKYIFKGYATYFGVGLAISFARLLLPKLRSPLQALSSIRGKDFKMALFFGSYISIYRAVICYLCRKQGLDSALYALPAGYLSGLAFLFNPSLGIAIASLTAAAKMYTTILYEKKILPDNIPLPEMLYCFSQGILYHARLMHPEMCPSYMFKLMNIVSSGGTEQIADGLITAAMKGL